VEVAQLSVRYGDVVAVDGLSFGAEAGEITVVLGPNGAGKTSTLGCLEGYRKPSAGTVRVCGLDPIVEHDQVVRRIGVMLQDGGVYTGIRPSEVLRLFAAFYDDPLDPDELLAMVGLEHRRSASWRSLSGGEQQRLSFALALVGRPEVAFLDEPTAGVDISGKQLIRSRIEQLRADGVAVVLTTHDLEEAEALADRIVIIDAGRIVADGSPDELLSAETADHFEFRAGPDLDVASLATAIGAKIVEEAPGAYRIETTPTPADVAALATWLAERDELIGDLRAGRQRLDELFLRLTGEQSPAEIERSGGRRRRQVASGRDAG
jgi:ABC-2 type transport system ATP-binding protein